MALSQINSQIYANSVQRSEPVKPAAEKTVENKNNTAAEADQNKNVDTFVKSTSEGYIPAYSRNSASRTSDSNVRNDKAGNTGFVKKSALQIKNESMQSLVSQMLGKQVRGESTKLSLTDFPGFNAEGIAAFNAAEKAVEGMDDYWGSDATSERIFTFAKTLAGEDPDKMNEMKNAFLKGYSQAVGVLGGKSKVPGVVGETYDKVMDKFSSWEKEHSSVKASDETQESDTK